MADFAQPPAFTYGNESRTGTTLRSHGIAGRVRLQFRGEIFNLFDRVQFGCQGQTFGTPQFGVVSSQQDLPGLVQFALRLKF